MCLDGGTLLLMPIIFKGEKEICLLVEFL